MTLIDRIVAMTGITMDLPYAWINALVIIVVLNFSVRVVDNLMSLALWKRGGVRD